MRAFRSLKRPPLFKEVHQQLLESLRAGLFKQGDKLPSERELVQSLKVSRTTVRDALRNLQHQGLITIRRGIYAGAYVSEPSPRPITQSFEHLIHMGKVSFSHLMEVRLYLEPEISARAAATRTDTHVEELRSLLDRAGRLLETSRRQARLLNVRFHHEVAKLTGNPILIFISESITQVYSAFLIEGTQFLVDRETILERIDEHRQILKAIQQGDAEGAQEKTKNHLIRAFSMYSEMMPEKRFKGKGW